MKLLIARHGNTFAKGETPRRVGCRTDLPLVESGFQQAEQLGLYLKKLDLIPNIIYCSELLRTKQTAEIIRQTLDVEIPINISDIFNEVDYGIDENKTEDEVIARIGKKAIDAWDNNAIVPPGWQIQPAQICQQWQTFANEHLQQKSHDIILVVTSNGVARFAPSIISYAKENFVNRKMATGSLSLLEHEINSWNIAFWGVKPD